VVLEVCCWFARPDLETEANDSALHAVPSPRPFTKRTTGRKRGRPGESLSRAAERSHTNTLCMRATKRFSIYMKTLVAPSPSNFVDKDLSLFYSECINPGSDGRRGLK
jgi:hypothetical protein